MAASVSDHCLDYLFNYQISNIVVDTVEETQTFFGGKLLAINQHKVFKTIIYSPNLQRLPKNHTMAHDIKDSSK